MNRWMTAAFSAASLLLAVPALAADKATTAPAGTKTEPAKAADAAVTLKGEILDAACFFGPNGGSGAGHKACAAKCLSAGGTAAFQAEDGTVYLLLAEHGKEKMLETCKKKGGETVTITGTVSEKGGMKALLVTDVKA